MANKEDYFLREPMPDSHERDADGKTTRQNIISFDNQVLPDANQYFRITWYRQPMMKSPATHIHDTPEYIGFLGSDPLNPKELNGKVLFWLDGEWITIEKSAIIYVPAGMAHCPFIVQEAKLPIIHFSGCPSGHYEQIPTSESTFKRTGSVEDYVSYDSRPFMPGTETDPSILSKIVWLDSSIMPGAPYIEFSWFLKAREPKPPTHVHDFDEIVGFIGSNPDDPGDLGATLNFKWDGENIRVDRSVVVYIPAGTYHCPFLIEDMKRPILSFSGGDGNRY